MMVPASRKKLLARVSRTLACLMAVRVARYSLTDFASSLQILSLMDSLDESEMIFLLKALPLPEEVAMMSESMKDLFVSDPSDTRRFSPKNERINVQRQDITDHDIFCGRGERGSSHPGNVTYRRTIAEYRPLYKSYKSKHGEKTKLRNDLIDSIIHGRFIDVDNDGKCFLLTKEKARKKISQSLHE